MHICIKQIQSCIFFISLQKNSLYNGIGCQNKGRELAKKYPKKGDILGTDKFFKSFFLPMRRVYTQLCVEYCTVFTSTSENFLICN